MAGGGVRRGRKGRWGDATWLALLLGLSGCARSAAGPLDETLVGDAAVDSATEPDAGERSDDADRPDE